MNKYSYSVACVLLSIFSLPTFAQTDASVYKWVDSEKKTHYTDRPAPGKITEQNIEEKIRKAAGLAAKKKAKSTEKNSQYDTGTEEKPSPTDSASNHNTEKKDEQKATQKNTEPASTEAEQAKKQQESAKDYAKKLVTYCEQKKKNLSVLLQDSPVAWEKQGKTILLSADQRKEKVETIKTALKEKCSK